MPYRCAILDDYQNIALKAADWSSVKNDLDIKVFDQPFASSDDAVRALKGFQIVCAMRERTRFPRQVIEALPDLKLLITTGMRNASIDVKAANERGVVVAGTAGFGNPTAVIAIGLMIELTRKVGHENARMKSGQLWQTTIGPDLEDKTLGVLGLGKLGGRVVQIGKAMGMKAIAWSPNLTPEKARDAGADYVSKDDLMRRSDVLSIHVVLGDRSRGIIGARELGLMKPTAYLVNTARGPIVDEKALLAALTGKKIAGAGLDVFDVEPLPKDHPFRTLDNVVLTPHLGYVSLENYAVYFKDVVEDIRGFIDGKPVRVIPAG